MSSFALTDEQKKRYAARAAELLEEQERIIWVKGSWIADTSDIELLGPDLDEADTKGKGYESIGLAQGLGEVRKFLQKIGFGSRNRSCGVCAQGALMLALAEDNSIPDDVYTADLVYQFDGLAESVAIKRGDLNEDEVWDGIPDANDGRWNDQSEAIDFLRAMGK